MENKESKVIMLMIAAFLLVIGGFGAYIYWNWSTGGAFGGPGGGGSSATGPTMTSGWQNDPTAVIDLLTAEIDATPDDPQLYQDRSDAYMDLGDYAAAISDLDRAIELGADTAENYLTRGCMKEAVDELEGAMEDFDRTIELDPTSTSALVHRGRARRLMGDCQGAVEDFTKLAQQHPETAIHHELASAQQGAGDYAAALDSIDKYILIAGESHFGSMTRGVILYHLGNLEEARENLRRAVSHHYEDSADYAQYYLWLANARAGDREHANRVLREYLAATDSLGMGEWSPRIVSFLLGDSTEEELLEYAAGDAWQPAKEKLCEAYFYAGSVRLMAGDADTAAEYFQRAMDTRMFMYYEFNSAQEELRRLKASE